MIVQGNCGGYGQVEIIVFVCSLKLGKRIVFSPLLRRRQRPSDKPNADEVVGKRESKRDAQRQADNGHIVPHVGRIIVV